MIKRLGVIIFTISLLVSIAATYYKYIYNNDYHIESKPVDDFTEEDF